MLRHLTCGSVLAVTWLIASPPSALQAAAGPETVRIGEPALRFSAGFIRKDLPKEGVVLEATGNKRLYAAGDRLNLRLTRPQEAEPGTFYTVYRWVHEVFHPWSGQYLGDLYTMAAVVRVLEVKDDLAVTAVERIYDSISPGYGVMRFEPPAPEGRAASDDMSPTGTGTIVALPPQQTMTGKGSVVYIDWGRRDGLRAGDRLEVFRLPPGRPRVVIGTLKVLHAEEVTASALILQSIEPLQLGDRLSFKEAASPPETEPKQALESGLGNPDRPASEVPSRELTAEAAGAPGSATPQLLADLVSRLEFDPGQVLPTASTRPYLDEIASLLRGLPDQQVRIEGHADDQPIGRALLAVFPSNQELSVARAEAVAHYLVEKGGVDQTRLATAGFGETRPIASNRTEAGRKKNRRIEIRLVPPEGSAGSAPGPTPVRRAGVSTGNP